jgi:hypothetical protein
VSTPDYATPRPPRRIALLITAAVTLIIGSVVFLILFPHTNTPNANPSGPTSSQATNTNPANNSANNSAADDTLPSSAPTGITWKLVGQVAVPFSATDGPHNVSAGTATGYAHTPIGALIAAAQINTRAGYSAGTDSWEPTLQHQFVPSADRDALLQLLRQTKADGQPVAAPGQLAQIAGFRFYSYTPQTATLALALRSPSGAYALITLTVQWRDGDWQMVAPPGGHWTSVVTRPNDLTGVIPWGAS